MTQIWGQIRVSATGIAREFAREAEERAFFA
jgi:hypothetical protein